MLFRRLPNEVATTTAIIALNDITRLYVQEIGKDWTGRNRGPDAGNEENSIRTQSAGTHPNHMHTERQIRF
jgi:hypothetical protein